MCEEDLWRYAPMRLLRLLCVVGACAPKWKLYLRGDAMSVRACAVFGVLRYLSSKMLIHIELHIRRAPERECDLSDGHVPVSVWVKKCNAGKVVQMR